ncbi:unnamed protein product [Clavelina lepadiformis]|uniref:Elongator complex protein 1 n=1 Tax=Clavelina lepadiformis TaxID=159417 RepID=A0ABP0FCT6_CLALP
MKNLKLLFCEETELPTDVIWFTIDNETSKFFVAYSKQIIGYNSKDYKKCLHVNLSEAISYDKPIEIVGLQYMYGEEQLCIALRHGDVVLCNVVSGECECVGSVDCELLSMSWSPFQDIVIFVTNRGSVVVMTHDFDPITELELSAEGFGEGKFVNVGWGSKETQFQGSAGKYVSGKERKHEATDAIHDDNQVKIAWRGDGQYFAIGNVEQGKRRFRVWNQECDLQYTSEDMAGLESPFTWKPSGSLIASTQRKAHRHDVVFFELNGLQHGEFTLPFDTQQVNVKKLEWNSDSSVLMMIGTDVKSKQDYLQLWTVSNYHWALKQNLIYDEKIAYTSWDPEETLLLHVITKPGKYYRYKWATCIYDSSISHSIADDVKSTESSYIGVIDGTKVKLTPFYVMVVPPPMCAFQVHLNEFVNEVSFLQSPTTTNEMCALTTGGNLFCFSSIPEKSDCDDKVQVMAAGGNGFSSQIKPYNFSLQYTIDKTSDRFDWRTIHNLLWTSTDQIVATAAITGSNRDCIVTFLLKKGTEEMSIEKVFEVDGHIVGTCVGVNSGNTPEVIVQLNNGNVLKYNISQCETTPLLDSNDTPILLNDIYHKMVYCSFTCGSSTTFGLLALSTQRRLLLNNKIISNECTSFAIHDEYIIFTTSTHKLICFSRNQDVASIENHFDRSSYTQSGCHITEIVRSVDRGASLVTVTPSEHKVILQHPRGNLEVIYPRALVISVVKKYLNSAKYLCAFQLMRKHRINMNLFYDHNPEKFYSDIPHFIEDLNSADYLNLFLSDLHNDDVTVTMYNQHYPAKHKLPTPLFSAKVHKVDKICDAVLAYLKNADKKFFLSVLTAHVRKDKRETQKALELVKVAQDDHSMEDNQIHDALKYLHVLVDGRVLYQEALATYDLDLALTVVQMSHNDPKEYVPFLNKLKGMEEDFRKYTIDMYLKKYHRALINISKSSDHFSDCLGLIKTQNLYGEALKLFGQHTSQHREISLSYAEYLIAKHLYEEAGIILARSENHKKAIKCFTVSCNWQLAFASAIALQYPEKEYKELARTLANNLIDKRRFFDAAMILEQEVKDIEAAITILCKGHLWSSACRLIQIQKSELLLNSHLIPALLETASEVSSTLTASKEQFERHCMRIFKVREIKEERRQRNLLAGEGEGDLDSDIASDFGSTVTGSSLSSVNSRTSQRTAKSRRKQERKRFSLREGSRFEEQGLLQALGEIIKAFASMDDDVHSLIIHLSLFHMDQDAHSLQHLYKVTHDLYSQLITKIWIPPNQDVNEHGPHSTVNSIIANRIGNFNENLTHAELEIAIPPKLNSKPKCSMDLYFASTN